MINGGRSTKVMTLKSDQEAYTPTNRTKGEYYIASSKLNLCIAKEFFFITYYYTVNARIYACFQLYNNMHIKLIGNELLSGGISYEGGILILKRPRDIFSILNRLVEHYPPKPATYAICFLV